MPAQSAFAPPLLSAGFPVPLFSPGFMTLKADTVSGTLSVAGHCYLWYPGPSGERVGTTGLPNWQAGPYLPGQGDNVPCEYAVQHSFKGAAGQHRCIRHARGRSASSRAVSRAGGCGKGPVALAGACRQRLS